MKLKEIKNLEKSVKDEKIVEMKKELVKMNAQVATGSAIKNPGHIRQIKKTIARILTIQHETKKPDNVKEKDSIDKKQEVGKKV
jgi:large subunit ribosomal protein L29